MKSLIVLKSITALVTSDLNIQFLFTAVYASPSAAIREELWSHLDSLLSIQNLPWLVAGDFNEVVFDADKKGGRPVLGCHSFGR